MSWLLATFQKAASMMSGSSQVVNEDHLKVEIMWCLLLVMWSTQRTLVGLCRDLRGIAFAFNSKFSYKLLFEWMYPLVTDSKDWSFVSQPLFCSQYDNFHPKPHHQVVQKRNSMLKPSLACHRPVQLSVLYLMPTLYKVSFGGESWCHLCILYFGREKLEGNFCDSLQSFICQLLVVSEKAIGAGLKFARVFFTKLNLACYSPKFPPTIWYMVVSSHMSIMFWLVTNFFIVLLALASSLSYPAYTGLLLEALQLWFHDPMVTTPILKLMAELVLNRWVWLM